MSIVVRDWTHHVSTGVGSQIIIATPLKVYYEIHGDDINPPPIYRQDSMPGVRIYDAITQAIVKFQYLDKPIIYIATDSIDSGSQARYEDVRRLIELKTAEGWHFIWLRSGLNPPIMLDWGDLSPPSPNPAGGDCPSLPHRSHSAPNHQHPKPHWRRTKSTRFPVMLLPTLPTRSPEIVPNYLALYTH